jgi:hypothetical protein
MGEFKMHGHQLRPGTDGVVMAMIVFHMGTGQIFWLSLYENRSVSHA